MPTRRCVMRCCSARGSSTSSKVVLNLVDAVGRYESKMINYAFDAVLKSRKQMTDEAPLHKPVIGRIVLALMRTAMRVTNHVRLLKQRMARSISEYRGAGRDNEDFVLPARSGRQMTHAR